MVRIRTSYWKYVLVLAFTLLLGCEQEASRPREPNRPFNVPASSVWVGGKDGGVFVSVARSERLGTDMYFAEIHYVSGDLAYSGPMRLSPSGSAGVDPRTFEGWDGDTLYMSNNRQLKVQK